MNRHILALCSVAAASLLLIGTQPASAAALSVPNRAIAQTVSGWTAPKLLDNSAPVDMTGVSCLETGTPWCAAVDVNGNALIDNDGAWTKPANLSAVSLTSVSCVTTEFCVAVGGQHAYVYGGSSWSAAMTLDGATSLVSVSCPETTFCMAVDSVSNAFTFDGASWSGATNIDDGLPMRVVSCVSSSFCMAADDGPGNAVEYDGSTWTGYPVIDGGEPILSLACSSPEFCVAGDDLGNALTFNGLEWSAPVPSDTSYFTSISCITEIPACGALDSSGNFLVDEGGDWVVVASALHTPDELPALSCTFEYCVAVAAGVAWTDASSTVTKTVDTEPGTLTAVSCASATYCVAGDNFAHVFTYNGTGWSGAKDIATKYDSWLINQITGISCPTSGFCVAVGVAINIEFEGFSIVEKLANYAVTYNGSSWSGATNIDKTSEGYVTGVSCESATLCVAIDSAGNAVIDDGSAWTSADEIDTTGYALTSVSCSPAFCMAVDGIGTAYEYDGSWSHSSVDTSLAGVSCVASSSCMAVDGWTGNEITFAGTWSSPKQVVPFGTDGLDLVSCGASDACMVSDTAGRAFAWNGTEWTASTVSAGTPLNGLSCPTAGFCAAVEGPDAETYTGAY